MPTVRIYLFTYRRNILLQRAVEALLKQTHENWICELHNDCPEDLFPKTYINGLNDERFVIKNHPSNLGPTRSFNLAFQGCTEKYASILEDDNWWEPEFLEKSIAVLDRKPEIAICWTNMKKWFEQEDGTWYQNQENIWDVHDDTIFQWGHVKQCLGALHSNGAMLWRSSNANDYIIPDDALFNAVELIRERSFQHPLYLIAEPLANYSFTIQTSQSKKVWEWTAIQTLLAESFVKALSKKSDFACICQYYYSENKNNLLAFSLADIVIPVRYRWAAFIVKLKWILVNPLRYYNFKKYLRQQKETNRYILENTVRRGQIKNVYGF